MIKTKLEEFEIFSERLINLFGKLKTKIEKSDKYKNDISYKNFCSIFLTLARIIGKDEKIEFEFENDKGEINFSFGKSIENNFVRDQKLTKEMQEIFGIIQNNQPKELAKILDKIFPFTIKQLQENSIKKMHR